MTRAVLTLDPSGEVYGLPTYPWRCAPAGLATRRQLAALGLRPAGQSPAAQCLRPRYGHAGRTRGPLVAYLYRLDLSAPKREMTPGRWRAVRAMVRARMVCATCGRSLDYIPAAYVGHQCWDCADRPGTETITLSGSPGGVS